MWKKLTALVNLTMFSNRRDNADVAIFQNTKSSIRMKLSSARERAYGRMHFYNEKKNNT